MKKMNRVINLILIANIVSIICLNAQIRHFEILNSENEAIEYANLYFKKSNYGTVSDSKGIAELNLEKLDRSDTLQISCIGYMDKQISMDSLLMMNNDKIFMTNVAYSIDPVSIKADKVKYINRKAGVKTKLDLCQIGFFLNKSSAGEERGVVIKNDRECYLESINFNLASVSHDSMIYELNIYDYNDEVSTPLNSKRIFMKIDKSDLNKPISINIRNQNIKVKGDYLVSFEAVQVRENKWGIMFKSKCWGKDLFYVKDRVGKWRKEDDFPPAVWCKMNCKK